MTHWDGLVSSNSSGVPQRICILGATNRINDIDDAILRRMPKKFAIPLPGARQRKGIFKLVLKDTKKDPSKFSLDYLVRVTEGLSGSDIKEACRDAAMMPMRELIKQQHKAGNLRRTVNPEDIRGVRTDDFFRKVAAPTRSRGSSHGGSVLEMDDVDDDERVWTDASSDAEGATARGKAEKIDQEQR
jgi:SpoVK/Ycf46/Vps4 family AAA+-type ATPase